MEDMGQVEQESKFTISSKVKKEGWNKELTEKSETEDEVGVLSTVKKEGWTEDKNGVLSWCLSTVNKEG